MYLFDNPVLQRELIFNLRMVRAFALFFAYVLLTSTVVYLAWPAGEQVQLGNTEKAQKLFNLFVIGQFVLVALMAPAFAAGSVTGEKERKTYEMLLASPLKPSAILLGKILSSLCYLTLLIFSTLPIVMICWPLGGVSFYELVAAYVLLVLAAGTFGLVCVACSTYFTRTASSVVVSYLLILPLALLSVVLWQTLTGQARLIVALVIVPAGSVFIWSTLFATISARLLYPPDLGSEAKEVVDEEQELQQAVGMVIQRDQFPDNLFAPSRRNDLLADEANPVFDKEMRSEIFSGGTLMARLVIQVSMLLAIPLMAIFLFFEPQLAYFYVDYVILFNMLVGPVFMAGSVTSERERETLDLLLTTNLSSGQILWPKWLAGLRVSTVLTLFLVPPLVLAGLMIVELWPNWHWLVCYVGIILMTCVTTATVALFLSNTFRRSSTSLLVSYMVLILLFAVPVAVYFFADTFGGQNDLELNAQVVARYSFTSPFMAAASVPLEIISTTEDTPLTKPNTWPPVFLYFWAFYSVANLVLLGGMLGLFTWKWRIAQ